MHLFFANTAKSQFALQTPRGGAFQRIPSPIPFATYSSPSCLDSGAFADWNCRRLACALLATKEGWVNTPPCKTTFLLRQISLAVIANRNKSPLLRVSAKSPTKPIKSTPNVLRRWNALSLAPQSSWAAGHSYIAWSTVSFSWKQNWRRSSITIPLRFRFSFVRRILWQALHINTLVEFGTWIFQIIFQIAWKAPWLEHSPFFLSWISF